MQALEELEREDATAFLSGVMKDTDFGLEAELFAFIRQAGPKHGLASSRQIPFQWNIYRQCPQLRYTCPPRIIRFADNIEYVFLVYTGNQQALRCP